MKKLIIFDLDGVLIDSKEIHFNALNMALEKINKKYIITKEDHLKFYEGLPTEKKLQILTEKTNLPIELYNSIWQDKQEFTFNLLNDIEIDNNLIEYFNIIKNNSIQIAVASNSIRKTIDLCLNKLGIMSCVDLILSNEDVKNPKPHPEIYWKAMSYFNLLPEDTVIFEDSFVGRLAARQSGANLIKIINRSDLTYDKIIIAMNTLSNVKSPWQDDSLNILVPMAGLGSRFKDAGYTFPKPLIEVGNMPMIQAVVESLNIKANYIYIVQKEHFDQYNLSYLLNLITPKCKIVVIDGITEGAAITALKAKDAIDNDNPLLIVNSDQIVKWDSKGFMDFMFNKKADGGIATFKSIHPKWSYAKVDADGLVTEVAEKKPISNLATVGIYYWKNGSSFIKYAESMIDKDIRTNNEFYICPVFNEAILDNKKIFTFDVEEMWGVGTPEDLKQYILNKGIL